MRLQQSRTYSYTFFVAFLFLIALPLSNAAQATKEEKEQIKKFGSSLKKKSNKSDKSGKKKNDELPNENIHEETIRVNSNLVVNDILVANEKGYAVKGLTKEDFIVREDAQPQSIEIFSPGDNLQIPRSIVLLIDFNSFSALYFDMYIQAAKVMIGRLNPKDKVAIVNEEIKLVQPFTEDKELLKQKLDSMKKNFFLKDTETYGHGFPYETLMAVLNEMFDRNDNSRPIIIMQTQGDTLFFLKETEANLLPPLPASLIKKLPRLKSDLESRPRRDISFDDVYVAAEKSRATIYAVFPAPSLLGLSEAEQIERTLATYENMPAKNLGSSSMQRKKELEAKGERPKIRDEPFDQQLYYSQMMLKKQMRLANLSQVTGGWIDFLETPDQADAVYSRIFSDINQRYTIGYYSTNETQDGKRRAIKIEVKNHPKYIILGRKTYLP